MGEKVDAAVALEDGSVFYGTSFGAPGTVSGEIVFNTSMMAPVTRKASAKLKTG